MKILIPLAQGFEEIEAISIIDILRRAGIDAVTVYLDKNPVAGSHGIEVTADKDIDDINISQFESIVLPGGMPGSGNLKNNGRLIDMIRETYSSGKYIAAICAAPIVLEKAGILAGKKITCFPGYEKDTGSANNVEEPVTMDERIITGRGAGCAVPFALKIVETLVSKAKADELKKNMQVYWM